MPANPHSSERDSDELQRFPHRGQVAIVTGCGRPDGIGFAVAKRLISLGAQVVMSDRPKTGQPEADGELESLVDGLNTGETVRALAVRASVTSEADCADLVQRAIAAFGKLHVLVNNAGADHGGDRKPLTEVTLEDWNRVLSINLTGGFLMCRAAIPTLIASGQGRIVNIASLAALRGSATRAAYGASKAGLVGLTLALAVELAPHGITVNALCPGSIETARARSTARKNAVGGDIQAALRARAASIPVGRLGQTDEIAHVVSHLADPASAYLTGQVIAVDGGLGVRIPG